jgi:hypothetical protein
MTTTISAGNKKPLGFAARSVAAPELPPGAGERFGGYGVFGVPFAGGHYLALRHWTTSSIGPGYRAVWHRDPDRRWTVYSEIAPELSCARYLGAALSATVTTPVGIDWTAPMAFTVTIPQVLSWRLELSNSPATRMMSAVGSGLPAAACHAGWLLRPLGRMAGPMLSVGKIRLRGKVPNGQTFGAVPRRVWRVRQTTAELFGRDLGRTGRQPRQEHLGDFWLPQRGMFFADAVAVFSET